MNGSVKITFEFLSDTSFSNFESVSRFLSSNMFNLAFNNILWNNSNKVSVLTNEGVSYLAFNSKFYKKIRDFFSKFNVLVSFKNYGYLWRVNCERWHKFIFFNWKITKHIYFDRYLVVLNIEHMQITLKCLHKLFCAYRQASLII